MSSLFGRQGLEEALEARLKSYTYESTRPTLRWLFIGLAVFIAAVLFLASSDQALRSAADEWAQEGITQIPPTPRELGTALFVAQATLNDGRTACHQSARDEDENLDRLCVAGGYQNVAGFAASGQLDCSGPEKILTILNPPAGSGCARLAEIVDRYESLTNRSSLALAIVIITFIAAAFPFSTFTHRSSRNLLTLKSERQGRSPDWAVISFFIPVLNLFRPLLIFIELFKASDPRVRVGDAEAWKKQGGISAIVIVWALLWGAVVVFNPITVARIWQGSREGMADIYSVTGGLLLSELLLVALSVTAVFMAIALSRWQDARRAIVGEVTVVPPRPRDPLEKALAEDADARKARVSAGRDRDARKDSGRGKRN